jgi:branched-chain amino acid transport system permease protein
VLGSQILIVGLFAVSLDLILGYAGIVSLGHAAFFGLAAHGWGEPLSGLLVAAAVVAVAGFAASFLVVRGHGLIINPPNPPFSKGGASALVIIIRPKKDSP